MTQKILHRLGPERIDQIDLNILAALSDNARVSKVQMSDKVGVSAGRCYERMQRLEKTGVIRGYHADIDVARVASCLQFLVQIKLLNDTASRTKQFETAMLKMPEVIACQSVLGPIDYVVVVIAPTIERYQAIIEELRAHSADEFEFVTFPISKSIKRAGHGDFKQTIARMARNQSPED
jgi:Lrp/AsnC family transcriptional regulator of ectoine degradation